eukprot:gnl/MRDRNA2_/MRDRNA2_431803_c0_seq1.p1 gnl/MRDRNA2_/MRDRNA2_431803_c0~~gnl/MRDRNA2_/MRDRNA2_431803_c0_seq1.p1  ORF type:complete len:254 (+),score=31.55 gnl/MRDRNA2_/MRDRNA2_431803_c0_seq1:49-762(+)
MYSGFASYLLSSSWLSVRNRAKSIVHDVHLNTMDERFKSSHVGQSALKNPLQYPVECRTPSLPEHSNSASIDELQELSCLWLSMKSDDAIVGYACSTATPEQKEGGSDCMHSETYTHSVLTMQDGTLCRPVEYGALRCQIFRQSKQQELLCEVGDSHQSEGNRSLEIISKGKYAPCFQLKARSLCWAEALNPGMSQCVGLGTLLPVESLAKASGIWSSTHAQFDDCATSTIRNSLTM